MKRDQNLDYQPAVDAFMQACFGPEIAADKAERNHRFLEESLELVQSLGCTESEALQLVRYVFGRPVGDPPQEVGGVMVTLAALCTPSDLDMEECGDAELDRVWTRIDAIRAKQAAKPRFSPLPGPSARDPRAGGPCPGAFWVSAEGLPGGASEGRCSRCSQRTTEHA